MPSILNTAATVSPDMRRQTYRLGSNYLLHAARLVAEAIDRDVIKALIFLAISRANVSAFAKTAEAMTTFSGLDEVPPDEVRRHLRTIAKDSDVVAYCRGPFCVYADDVVRSLKRRGIRARRLEDGFPEWKRAGHDIAVGESGGA